MTVDGKLFEALEKKFRSRKWIWKTPDQPRFDFDRLNGANPNAPIAVVIDGLCVMYSAADNLINLINYVENIVVKVLEEPNVRHICVVFDNKAPPPKDVNGKDMSGVARTPFSVEHPHNAMDAWAAFHAANVNTPTVTAALASLVNVADAKAAYNLPFKMDFEKQLANRDYKAYVSKMLCQGVFACLRIPDHVTLLVRGPDFTAQRTGAVNTIPPKILVQEFREADFFCTTYANFFHRTHRVVVISEDGDTTLSLLLSQTSRMRKNDALLANVKFDNRVYHVRSWKSLYRRRTPAEQGLSPPKYFTYLDIEELWRAIQEYDLSLRQTALFNYEWQPIVPVVVMVCLMLKNDYVSGLPNIGPMTLFEAFERFIQRPTTARLLANTSDHRNLRLNFEHLLQLVIHCYQTRRAKVVADNATVEEALDAIRKAYKSEAEILTVDGLAVYFANIRWFMCYMIAAQSGELSDSGLETRNGNSIHGFVDIEASPNGRRILQFGRRSIKRAQTVDFEFLRFSKVV